MKKIIIIGYYEFLKNIRDKKMLVLLVLTPIVLIFLLGNSLKSFLSLEYLPAPSVGFVNEADDNTLHTNFLLFTNSDEISKLMVIKEYSSFEEIDNEVSAFIVLRNKEIEISGESTNYLEAIVANFINNYHLSHVLVENGLVINPANVELERGELNDNAIYPSSMDYYAILTLLHILTICGIFGISIILSHRQGGLFIRTNSLPIRTHSLLIGRILGSVLFVLIAAVTTILFSSLVYNANFNGNVLIIVGSLLLFIISIIGIGALIAQITKNYASSIGVLGLITVVFPAASGAFSPKSTIDFIAFVTPNHYAKNLMFAAIYDFPSKLIIKDFIIMTLICVVIYVAIFTIERRKKYENI